MGCTESKDSRWRREEEERAARRKQSTEARAQVYLQSIVPARAADLRAKAKALHPNLVLCAEKYEKALAAFSKADSSAVRASAVALGAAGIRFHAQFTEDIFDPKFHHDTGIFKITDDDLPCLKLFRGELKEAAESMCVTVATISDRALEKRGIYTAETVVQALSTVPCRDSGATQDVPDCFRGIGMDMPLPSEDPLGQLTSQDREDIYAAARIIGTDKSPNDLAAYHIDDPGLWKMPNNLMVGTWGQRLSEDQNALQGGRRRYIDGLTLLYARCVVCSRPFHDEMDRIFAGVSGAIVVHVPMKKYARSDSKCQDKNEYGKYMQNGEPWAHLKDVLRATVRCDTLEVLVQAAETLFAAHTAEIVKNRIDEPTHDIIAVIRFQGVLVEVQFHLGFVLDIKPLSHAAYNITRADVKNVRKLQDQNLVVFPYREAERDEQGVEGVQVKFLKFLE